MAAVVSSSLDKTALSELAVSYAALILHDEKLQITADNINKVLGAAHVQVDAHWPALFANALKGKDVARLLSGAGCASAGPVSSAPTTAAAPTAAAPKVAEKKEEEEEEEAGGAMSLFGEEEEW
jgi:ribosomal protein L12E/L44/L45/RPP1/RPP2